MSKITSNRLREIDRLIEEAVDDDGPADSATRQRISKAKVAITHVELLVKVLNDMMNNDP